VLRQQSLGNNPNEKELRFEGEGISYAFDVAYTVRK
jgi:hypothetical protein